MSESFNGYHVWLGIPPNEQPPNHYRLLGIVAFESDLDVIDHAADRQMAHVRTFQSGRNGPLSQQLLNELASARVCLLNAQRKAEYDEQLRSKLAATSLAGVPLAKAVPLVQPVMPKTAPRPAPAARKPSVDDDDAYELETPIAPTTRRAIQPVDDSEDDLLSEIGPAPRSGGIMDLDAGLPLTPVLRRRNTLELDASWQKAVMYILVGLGGVIVLVVIWGIIQRNVSVPNWREWFKEPVVAPAPQHPAKHEPAPAAPVPAPPGAPKTDSSPTDSPQDGA